MLQFIYKISEKFTKVIYIDIFSAYKKYLKVFVLLTIVGTSLFFCTQKTFASFSSDISGATQVYPVISSNGTTGFDGTLDSALPSGVLDDVSNVHIYRNSVSSVLTDPNWFSSISVALPAVSGIYTGITDLSACMDSSDYNALFGTASATDVCSTVIQAVSGATYAHSFNFVVIINSSTGDYFYEFGWDTISGTYVSGNSGLTFSSPAIGSSQLSPVNFVGTWDDIQSISPDKVLIFIVPRSTHLGTTKLVSISGSSGSFTSDDYDLPDDDYDWTARLYNSSTHTFGDWWPFLSSVPPYFRIGVSDVPSATCNPFSSNISTVFLNPAFDFGACMTTIFSGVSDTFGGFFSDLTSGFSSLFSGLATSIGGFFSDSVTSITGAFSSLGITISGLFTDINSWVSNFWDNFSGFVSDAVDRLVTGITDMFSYLFVPTSASLNQFSTLTLEHSIPFSYIYDMGNVWNELFSNSGSMSYDVGVDDGVFGHISFISASQISAVPFASTIKTILGYLLYFFTAYTLYRLLLRSHSAQH